MDNILEKLTKEDLIKVIANMHDTIQEWNNGWGLEENEAETLIKIGSACTSYCNKKDYNLPKVEGEVFPALGDEEVNKMSLDEWERKES